MPPSLPLVVPPHPTARATKQNPNTGARKFFVNMLFFLPRKFSVSRDACLSAQHIRANARDESAIDKFALTVSEDPVVP